ncbi:MAG: type II toxin-antitoxin system RelE/ParE family toxin [Phycisphaerales bacterium]|nr:MAG: type II toxin-antitoxin system RelE/ParE family toxin [Phycisphaerales bacterium]
MAYRIEIDRQALKALAALPKKVQRQVAARIDALAEDPFPSDAQQIKGQDDIWRIRSGSYRIAYTVRQNILCILVLRVGDRKDFYRHFNR